MIHVSERCKTSLHRLVNWVLREEEEGVGEDRRELWNKGQYDYGTSGLLD